MEMFSYYLIYGEQAVGEEKIIFKNLWEIYEDSFKVFFTNCRGTADHPSCCPDMKEVIEPIQISYLNLEERKPLSTCSLTADRRGLHQKVIAYSIYGDFSQKEVVNRYLKPLRETIKTIPSIYPGWITRIYHNQTHNDSVTSAWTMLRKELNVGAHLPLLDEMVDAFMSRDSDSLIIQREQDAVAEWLASDRVFHIMRDHHLHCTAILGGMWGAKISQDRSRIAAASYQIFKEDHRIKYGYDQLMLTKFMWPIARNNLLLLQNIPTCPAVSHKEKWCPFHRKQRTTTRRPEIPMSQKMSSIKCHHT
ncbi:hypothetical protein OUZ56_011079 [Daphnia magna]|uniref:Uncharacterized protein n=1 Tax=Daphnia magna TaxID=35525 RepID=A0ABQ9YZ78_9CRUS|nr:hypothetical protein OUZ56_011079 [Daphnia magna]